MYAIPLERAAESWHPDSHDGAFSGAKTGRPAEAVPGRPTQEMGFENSQEIMEPDVNGTAVEQGMVPVLPVPSEKHAPEILKMWVMQRLTKQEYTIY